jgi:hypothetical protein
VEFYNGDFYECMSSNCECGSSRTKISGTLLTLTFCCCRLHRYAVKHCCAALSIFILPTVTCASTIHRKHCCTAVTIMVNAQASQWYVLRTFPIFHVQGSVHHEYMSIIVQQDETIYSLFISVNCSICFGWYLHPSSGAHVTVSTPSGICKTVTETFRERDWTGTRKVSVTVLQMPDAVDTVTCAPYDGWRYHPKHIEEQFTDINKLYIVASCWTIIDILSISLFSRTRQNLI